jgi:hypothetical protein
LKNGSTVTTAKTLIKQKAVFFGEDCDLPYLQSSDTISHLYAKKSYEQDQAEAVLFNPPASIDRSFMTSLKSLHIYHTSV